MKLFEYQAKELFGEAGIPTPKGVVITGADELKEAIKTTGVPCVVKSQVLKGGRGKVGLIQFAKTELEAEEKVNQLAGGPHKIKIFLIEEGLKIDKEIYMAITIDPVDCSALIMASSEGGMDIEEIAKTAPEKIIREKVKPFRELMPYQTRNVMFGLGLKGDAFKQGCKILMAMFKLFKQYDAELVEINPLVVLDDGSLMAADGKFSIDDNAAYRQKRFELTPEHCDGMVEYDAKMQGFPYLQFDGDIGLMCAGAGLTNTVFDLVNYAGGKVANYLEFGGPNYKRAVEAMEFTIRNKPKVILIVTFGTIARADVMAEGIAKAINKLKPEMPIVTAIRGTGEEEATRILKEIGLEPLMDTEQAVNRAVGLAKGAVQ